MTPTEQDNELREAIIGIVEAEYKSPNYTPAVKRVDYIMQLITADRKRVALEARLDELRKMSDLPYIGLRAKRLERLGDRAAELKAKQEEV